MNVSALGATKIIEPQKLFSSNASVRAYAALTAGQALKPWAYEPGPHGFGRS
jgi:hypothetical protein